MTTALVLYGQVSRTGKRPSIKDGGYMKVSKRNKQIIGFIFAIIIVILIGNPKILPFSQQTIDEMLALRHQHNWSSLTPARMFTFVGAMAMIYILYCVVKFILDRLISRKRSRTIATLMVGILRYMTIIIAFVWGLSILGVNTTAVLAGAGIVGLVIGFGAQSLIEDIITGLFIIFEQQYEIGDIIILDDFRGVVRSIGVRTTVIEDTGGNLKVVNNSDIRNFQNRSKNASYAVVDVGVSYNTNIPFVEKVVGDAIDAMYDANCDLYLDAPEYMGVEELADSAVILRFRVKTKEENVFNAKRQLNRDLKLLFDTYGIEIPFPQVVVHQFHKETTPL